MMIFQFKNHDVALEFWERVQQQHADSLEERQAILLEMAKEGKMERVVQTGRTKEEVMKDWSKHYRVLDIQAGGGQEDADKGH